MAEVVDRPGAQIPSATLGNLFLTSFLALYFELLIIRYLSTEIRTFAYLKNLPLLASFLGIGLGMILGWPKRRLWLAFPWVAAALFLMIRFAAPLHLTHIGLAASDYFVWGNLSEIKLPAFLNIWLFLLLLVVVLGLITALFVVLGGMVGHQMKNTVPLRGYGVNLAGSLAGVGAFTALSFYSAPPVVWLLCGLLLVAPFFRHSKLALLLFAAIILFTGLPDKNTWWSPYYRIDLSQLSLEGQDAATGTYFLSVNHDYHQKLVDLSPGFMAHHGDQEPNRSAFTTYELPYRLVPNPSRVLIVGAGTGNDVAAALRHGVSHVDAVEIDPIIQSIGRRYHPEQPYASPRVSVHINDARAFLKTSRERYDLIVFGYLDAHTLISSYSSLRLDNYVYTVQSFQEARNLLTERGSLILAFASGKSFITDRMYATLQKAFDKAPVAYLTGYDTAGVVFVEGPAADSRITDFPLIVPDQKTLATVNLATDSWPFLYLDGRRIPTLVLIAVVTFIFLGRILLRDAGALPWRSHREYLHLLLLGAGFLLLETKGVTDLALLFGSTWVVNAIAIAVFLTMALAANALAMVAVIPRPLSFAILFVTLAVGIFVPYSILNGASLGVKLAGAALLAGLPVFFSGLIFSDCFRDVVTPAEALGVNLFGAMIGGVLENVVMIGGTTVLGVMALLLYVSAFVFIRAQRRSPDLAPVTALPARSSN